MSGSKTHIYLGVEDVDRSALFYEALLGGPPATRETGMTVFEFDAPPLVLTITSRPPSASAAWATHAFALVVPLPEHVGRAAIALRRTGARLRLQDEGIEAHDPDGNTWKVRFVASAKVRSVVPNREGAAP